MERICPNCKIKLGSYDRYFCTACGTVLPKELINTKDVYRHIANFSAIAESAKKKAEGSHTKLNLRQFVDTKTLAYALIALVVFVIGGVYIRGFIFSSKPISVPNISLNNKAAPTLATPLAWKTGTFGSDKLFEAVPYTAEIIIEGFDITGFGALYADFDDAYTDLNSYLTGQVHGHFIFFANKVGEEYQWSLAFIPAEKNFVLSEEMLAKYPWLKLWKSEPVAVLSPQAEILDEVNAAKSGIAKNFTHTTMFASSRASIPSEIKMVTYVKDEAAREYLRGVLLLNDLPEEIRPIIEETVNSKSEYNVIL